MTDIMEALQHNPEADNFDFKASLDSIRNSIFTHLGVVLAVIALTLLLVLTYIRMWPPVFDARVIVSADAEADLQRNTFYQTWNVFRREAAADEAILMTSDPVLRRVIVELDLTFDEVYHPFMSQVIHLWGESWVGSNYRKIKYRFFPLPPPPPGLTEEMIEQFKVLKDLRASVAVQPIGDANVALLIVKGPTPRVAEIANKIIDVYLDERRNRYVREAELAMESLGVETERSYSQLVAVEQELQDFYSENSLLLAFEKDRVQLTQWLSLEADIMSLKANEARLSETLQTLNRQLASEGTAISDVSVYQDNIVTLREQRTQLEITLNQQQQRFLPDSREVRDISAQLAALTAIIEEQEAQLAGQESKSQNQFYETVRAQIAQTETDLSGTRAALESKTAMFEELRPLMSELPYKMQRTHDLQRQQLLLEAQYKLLNDKLVQASISATTARSAPSAIHVIDYASPPDKPGWPNTKFMLLVALFVGGILGVITALALDLIFVKVTRQNLGFGYSGIPSTILEKDDKFVELVYGI